MLNVGQTPGFEPRPQLPRHALSGRSGNRGVRNFPKLSTSAAVEIGFTLRAQVHVAVAEIEAGGFPNPPGTLRVAKARATAWMASAKINGSLTTGDAAKSATQGDIAIAVSPDFGSVGRRVDRPEGKRARLRERTMFHKVRDIIRSEGAAGLAHRSIAYAYRRGVRPWTPSRPVRYSGIAICRDAKWGDKFVPASWVPDPALRDRPRYEAALVAGLSETVRLCDKVVIVGAGFGVTAVVAARRAGPSGTVQCFEGSEVYVSVRPANGCTQQHLQYSRPSRRHCESH